MSVYGTYDQFSFQCHEWEKKGYKRGNQPFFCTKIINIYGNNKIERRASSIFKELYQIQVRPDVFEDKRKLEELPGHNHFCSTTPRNQSGVGSLGKNTIRPLYETNLQRLKFGQETKEKIFDERTLKIIFEDEPEKIVLNEDFAVIPGVHPKVLLESDVVSHKQKTSEISKTITIPGLANVMNHNKNNEISYGIGICTVKSSFLSKSYRHNNSKKVLFRKNGNQLLQFCFGGHWGISSVLSNDTGKGDTLFDGEHVVPRESIRKRIDKVDFKKFRKDNITEEELKKYFTDLAFFDAMNLVPLCRECHQKLTSRDDNIQKKIEKLLNFEVYGDDFFKHYIGDFEYSRKKKKVIYKCNYQNQWAVPRTKQGHGFGDAMMFHVFWNYEQRILKGRIEKSQTQSSSKKDQTTDRVLEILEIQLDGRFVLTKKKITQLKLLSEGGKKDVKKLDFDSDSNLESLDSELNDLVLDDESS